MPRLLFEKTGNAVWISHLDLMRLFQRAFKRAGLSLKHSQGFNPRPFVSIALPLSVGVQSHCELLDFDLDVQDVSCEEIVSRLNQALVSGVKVLQCYDTGRKLKELSLLRCAVLLQYDNEIENAAHTEIKQLFSRDSVTVPKKTKNGVQDQDIIPMIHEFALEQRDKHTLRLEALISCQNPTLNPMQLATAIALYLPEYQPDDTRITRLELYDADQTIFR